MENWKCKKCGNINTISTKQKRDFQIANTFLTLFTGGFWLLLMIMKEALTFSFADSSSSSSSGIKQVKNKCKKCNTER